jgi:hypothetical protein
MVFELAPTLALVDTARVIEMVENQILKADERLIEHLALGLYADNPNDAIAALDALDPAEQAVDALLDLFDKFPDASTELRRTLLAHALTRTRDMGHSVQQVGALARIADRWFVAGDPAQARPLLEAARADFRSLASRALPIQRAALAEALARVDVAAAVALMEGAPNQQPLAGIARRAAATDPAEAERIFGRLSQRNVKLGVLADLCAGMATKDLPRALDFATRVGAPGVAALTVAAASQRKASTDSDGAKALLADAFNRLEGLSGRMVVPAVAMARLLPLAVRLDPDRSSEYFWRAVAARSPRVARIAPEAATPLLRQQYLTLARQAALLSQYDREVAETIFAPVLENARALVDDRMRLQDESSAILQAAAVYEPRVAVAIVDALSDDPEPASKPRSGEPPHFTPRTKESARLTLARALAMPPELRRREALRTLGQPDLWPTVLDCDVNTPGARTSQ